MFNTGSCFSWPSDFADPRKWNDVAGARRKVTQRAQLNEEDMEKGEGSAAGASAGRARVDAVERTGHALGGRRKSLIRLDFDKENQSFSPTPKLGFSAIGAFSTALMPQGARCRRQRASKDAPVRRRFTPPGASFEALASQEHLRTGGWLGVTLFL